MCNCEPVEYEILAAGRIYSTHEYVNVIPNFTRSEWLNNFYSPAKNASVPVKEHLRRKVMDMLESMHNTYFDPGSGAARRTIGWFDRISSVTITPDDVGEYRFTVWGAPYRVRVEGPTGTLKFLYEESAKSYIHNKCIGSMYEPVEFSMTILPTES